MTLTTKSLGVLMGLALAVSVSAPVRADEPYMVLRHNGFGLTIALPDDGWSFSPAGRYGISIQKSKLKLSLRVKREGKAKRTPEMYREANLKSFDKAPDKTLVMSRDDTATVAGGTEAVGITIQNIKRKNILRRMWFISGNGTYSAQCEARDEKQVDAVHAACAAVLEAMKLH